VCSRATECRDAEAEEETRHAQHLVPVSAVDRGR
jgi:hypothetical protein